MLYIRVGALVLDDANCSDVSACGAGFDTSDVNVTVTGLVAVSNSAGGA